MHFAFALSRLRGWQRCDRGGSKDYLWTQERLPGALNCILWEQGWRGKDVHMIFLKVEPKWDEYRSDQRFADLLRWEGLL
jgi:hypothetical protein